jgi:hypothetical protein
MQLFRTAYPTVDPDVVEAVVCSLKGDTDAIIWKLQELAFVPTDTEMLRMQVASMARNKHMPALRKQNARGDGKCMFHAVAKCLEARGHDLTGDNLFSLTLHMMRNLKGDMRELIIAELKAENIAENIDSQKTDQELLKERINALKKGAHGDKMELRLLADKLDLKIHIWIPLSEYARKIKGKDPSSVKIVQVSQHADYVLSSDYTHCGHGKIEVHLLYSEMCHYDSLLKD